MAWLIKNGEGVVCIADLGLTFHPHQLKNVDLVGRSNAERSSELKQMLQKGQLEEIKKDPSEDTIDPKLVQQLNQTLQQTQITLQQAQETTQAQNGKISALETQNDELKKQNQELAVKIDTVLNEVRAFAEKMPLDAKVFAEALRNATSEKQMITAQREALSTAGESEAEIKMQDKILALKEKKLEKNIKNLGSTISQSADDFKDTLNALDELNI
jgi:hypothetical protein